jgi:hypothetical protein
VLSKINHLAFKFAEVLFKMLRNYLAIREIYDFLYLDQDEKQLFISNSSIVQRFIESFLSV